MIMQDATKINNVCTYRLVRIKRNMPATKRGSSGVGYPHIVTVIRQNQG